MTLFTITNTVQKNDRTYYFADTPLGKILYYQFETYTQYRNLTNHDFCWSILSTDEFEKKHSVKPIDIFASERLPLLEKAFLKVTVGGMTYSFRRKKEEDGYIYLEETSLLRMFSKKDYPKQKFVYQRFHINVCQTLHFTAFKKLYEDELVRFNKGDEHASYVTDTIFDELWGYLKAIEEQKNIIKKISELHLQKNPPQLDVLHDDKLVVLRNLSIVEESSMEPFTLHERVLNIVKKYYPNYAIGTGIVDSLGETFNYLSRPI